VNDFQRAFFERTLAQIRFTRIVGDVNAGIAVPITVVEASDLVDDASKRLDEAADSRL